MLKVATASCLLLLTVSGLACANPPSNGLNRYAQIATDCPRNREMVNGGCAPLCRPPHVRNQAGACVCPAGTVMGQNGICGARQQACPANATRNDAGACVQQQQCPSGTIWVPDSGVCARG